MAFLAEQVLLGEGDLRLDALLEALAGVSLDQVNRLAQELLADRLALAAVGPVSASHLPTGGWEIAS